MTFTFTQQIETTQNAIAQLNQKLDFYSQTDEYLIQSENLLHSVTELFEEKDLQIIRDRLQYLWSIVPRLAANENKYDTTAEIESRDTEIVELQNKIKSLEFNLETALTQRDRSTEKYNELLKQSIDSNPEVEFLDTFHELCTDDESPQELESRDVEVVLKEEVKPEVLEVRIKNFIKSFNVDKTTWEDMRQYIRDDGEKFLQQLTRGNDREAVTKCHVLRLSSVQAFGVGTLP